MPPKRGKWSSPRGIRGSRSRPPAPQGGLRNFLSTSPNPSFHGFSMRDEARNTASHQSSLWGSGDAKLRMKPVTFVSAGFIEPLKEKPSEDPSDSNEAEALAEEAVEGVVENVLEAFGDTVSVDEARNMDMEPANIIEVETIMKTLEQETSTTIPVPENQNGDVSQLTEVQERETKDLFFYDLGDQEDEAPPSLSLLPPEIRSSKSSVGDSDSSEEVILFRGRTSNAREPARKLELPRRAAPAKHSATPVEAKPESKTSAVPSNVPEADYETPAPQFLQTRPRSRRRRSEASVHTEEDEGDDENAILADYIANMAANSDDDFIASHLQSLSGERDIGGDHHAVNFGSGDGKSPQGDEYLGEESEASEGSGISDADENDFLNGDDDQDMDADMDDETLARLLAKQEELGLGGDDLVIFSSSYAKTGTRQVSGKRPANGRRSLNGPASATQVADAFDSLDLDDWAHLTGQQPRKRRSKRPPNFNADDSDIETALRSAWENDRERKKSRKLERETLRAEGLLGKNANPGDLHIKYPSGMKLDDIKTELTSFLISSAERLDFPPLDKHARKILHELANKFNIKSQSTGKGDQRRPVLYRTKRTVQYASARIADASNHVHEASLRIHRKYFHRVDVKVKGAGPPRNGGGRGGGGHKALTLREGEVVGASVPELGAENKGRNMLEKMGWSKGMALGAGDNKGILEPVAQVMKRSKAGLG
ncbi:hypothetical protein VTI74DRAFT_7350 [Chaetomium olivicolor]